MNVAMKAAVSADNSPFPQNWLDSINSNRANLLQFLSNANASLPEPEGGGKNIPRICNDLYDVIESSAGDAKTAAEQQLTLIYKNNSTLPDGSQLSDEYVSVIMALNFSTNPLELQSLIGVVGDAIFAPVFVAGFTDSHGINLLNSLIATETESVQRWILNLTFELHAQSAFKASVNRAIASSDIAELTELLNGVEWDGVGSVQSHQLYITQVVNGLATQSQSSFDKAQQSSLTFKIGEIAYVQLW
ncbi:hypothetical protein [Shewanella sp. YLB-07]|uniref:hypothetical protein n=1 Tax=Shewanella sp. YLB-07 TaxID=2601268 RepID=UPI00128B86AD|nr:hypothetical protein [Shewanella sp. YLB-07]MPY26892.1 hypothetical protein [Shewanella sp. YLB-07]